MRRTFVGLVFFKIRTARKPTVLRKALTAVQLVPCDDLLRHLNLHRLHRPTECNLKETLNDCFMWLILQNLVKILWYSSKNKLLLANTSALVASIGLNMLYLTWQITCPCILLRMRLACLWGFITWVLPDYLYPSIFCWPYWSCLSSLAFSL